MKALSIVHVLVALAAAPLLSGVINRIKARFAGRRGQSVLQLYFDLWKLLGKGAVYSRTTTWLFLAGPIIALAAVVASLLIVPLGTTGGVVSFGGDLVLLAYLLGLMRFATVLAAMDTGSAFEGMGASREVQFALLAEPVLFIALAALAAMSRSLSLSEMYAWLGQGVSGSAAATLALLGGALFIVLLAENARIPVDDPNTHLELTMIHEVMVLDHSGPDFAMIQYAASLKLWVLGALVVGLAAPALPSDAALHLPALLAGMVLLAVCVGAVESTMARLRMLRVPRLLLAAGILSLLGLILVLR
jgi:formate hydrogenlyase subunit 4